MAELDVAGRARLQAAYDEDPTRGRYLLAKAASVTESMAHRFLVGVKKRGKGAQPPDTSSPPPDAKYSFLDNLPEHELSALRKSILTAPAKHEPQHTSWAKSSFKFAFLTDTHIGHKLAHRRWWDMACSFIDKEKCDFALHGGDITEGMSGRPGHVYELDHIGVSAQVRETVERFRQLPCLLKGITGNHDAWQFKQAGVDPGDMIAEALPNQFKYLGMDEADVIIQGIDIKIWHGGDGSSYATSYRTQKFVEGLSGGEKPHILLSGHAHKSIFHVCRNVMTFEGGTLCGQTGWMRGKKLAAHCGFWIIEVWPSDNGGVERIKSEWVPLFV